ncbi:MAG TPA: SDR family oxidoreductase [Mycobacteriales bacterium]|nr:SDR family oxidoreductase [Mycobacteriales bacterium]
MNRAAPWYVLFVAPERKVVVVTGGSAGVGRAVVREFAHHGYDVAILARGQAGLDAAAREVKDAGGATLPIAVDVADPAAVDAAADRVERELGEIDVWVNVAFVGALRFFWDTDDATYRRITEVTYFGQVNGTRAALARMRPRDRGVIVQVGSALAFRGIPLQAAYCGAKHAVKGFTESVITELKHERSRVRVCMVQLPGVNTTQFTWNDNAFASSPRPVAPVFQPEPAARAVRFLAEHPRRNLWVGVSTAYTILGNRVAPWLLDLYLARTGVKGQLADEPKPRHGSNVFTPRDADQDRGAHGPYDDQSHPHDPWSFASMHRRVTATAGAVAGLAGVAAVAARRARR